MRESADPEQKARGAAFCHSSVLKAFNASASLPAEQLKQTRTILLRIQSKKLYAGRGLHRCGSRIGT